MKKKKSVLTISLCVTEANVANYCKTDEYCPGKTGKHSCCREEGVSKTIALFFIKCVRQWFLSSAYQKNIKWSYYNGFHLVCAI